MDISDYQIQVIDVSQQYPGKDKKINRVLNNISFGIEPGEFVTIVGPTGCGKSTLLRLILGSELPVNGQVIVGQHLVREPDKSRGIVLQRYSLFAHLTVRENVMFGLELREFNLFEPILHFLRYRKREKEFRERANKYLKKVGLIEHGDKYPHQLSGGMKQRAAIAQTMIMQPQVLMMDEPFGALDAGTREEMQIFVLEQWQHDKQTVIFVTHDLEEAIFLGTRIIVLSQYYTGAGNMNGKKLGAKIVKDVASPWPHPRPTNIKKSPEFTNLINSIRHEGLDPEFRQHIRDFDLSHKDAAWWHNHKAIHKHVDFGQ